MKQLKYAFLLPVSFVLILLSCGKDPINALTSGNWVYLNNSILGDQRNSAVSFVVGNNAYVGTGYNQALNKRYSDLYSFNPTAGWTQLVSAPAGFTPRSNAVAFAIGTNGYITLGQDNNNNYLPDTWQYSTTGNSWSQKDNFTLAGPNATTRIDAMGFSINTLGYVMCGYDGGGNKKDAYSFDPTLAAGNQWKAVSPSFNGGKRQGGIVWVYKNKAYIVTGTDNGVLAYDFTVFDPTNITTPWVSLRNINNSSSDNYDDDYTDIVRDHGVGFVLGDSAYICLGNNGGYSLKTWGYDFVHDTWFRKTSFEKSGRSNTIAFTIQGQSFITTGKSNSQDFDDLNQWFPYQDYNVND